MIAQRRTKNAEPPRIRVHHDARIHSRRALADCRDYILALPTNEHAQSEGVVAELLTARSGLSRGCASHGRCIALRALVRRRSVVISVSLEGEAGPQMKEAAN